MCGHLPLLIKDLLFKMTPMLCFLKESKVWSKLLSDTDRPIYLFNVMYFIFITFFTKIRLRRVLEMASKITYDHTHTLKLQGGKISKILFLCHRVAYQEL